MFTFYFYLNSSFFFKKRALLRELPPHVAAFGEEGEFDDLGRHPGIGARRAHLGGLVPLSGQAEIRDLQGFPAQADPLQRLQDEN